MAKRGFVVGIVISSLIFFMFLGQAQSPMNHSRKDDPCFTVGRSRPEWLGLDTAVQERPDDPSHPGLPKSFGMSHSAPNPFNPSTNIHFQVPKTANVQITVFDMLGRQVKVLVDRSYDVGYHMIRWDGTGEGGIPVAAGTYFFRMRSEDYLKVIKGMLVK